MRNFNQDIENKIREADDLMRRGESSVAIVIIKKMINAFPDEEYLHYLLGVARMKCGRFFLAQKALERANQLFPNNPENLRSLGWVKVMIGEIENGRKYLREAINLDLTNPLFYLDLAMSYFNHFDFQEGFAWLERAQALAPNDPYVLKNYQIAKKMEKEASRYSVVQLQKMKEEQLKPEGRRKFRLAALQYHFMGKDLSKDEAEEIREELKMNGVEADILTTPRKFDRLPSKKEILKKRKEIAKELSSMLRRTKSPFTVEYIKDLIYREKDPDDLEKVVSIFGKSKNIKELKQTLAIINDAWNYFPHKCLGGLCPMEKILDLPR